MPTYIDILKFEEDAPKNTIRLIKSGEFYRAYNHSAWLFHCCIAEHKVMRKYVKALKQDIFYVGFPNKSLFNNIGERNSVKTESGFDIELSIQELPNEEEYEIWVASVQSDYSSKGDYNSLPIAGIDAEKEVIKRIKDFPLENKTMVECAVFIAELRKLLNNI